MKKIISVTALLLVVLMMTAALAACGSGGKLTPGSYQLKEATGSSAEQFNAIKDSLVLEVQEGGKASLNYAGISAAEMVFDEENGKVSFQDSVVPYKIDGNKIIIEDAGGKLVFEK